MGLFMNGTAVGGVYWNGVEAEKVYFNGTLVFEKPSGPAITMTGDMPASDDYLAYLTVNGVTYGLTGSGRQNWPKTIAVPVGTEVTITMSQSGGGSGAWLNGTRVLLVPMIYYDTPYTYTFTVTGAVNVTFEANDGGGGGIFTITMEG